MDKKKIIIIAIAIILMIIIGAITSCSCGNSKKSPITKSSQEISSDEVSTEQSTENEEVETTNLETTTSNAEETTTPAVTEEVTTKPVVKEETTTKKPVQQTTAKPTSKPVATEQTTTKPATSTWKPEYYTAADKIGDGLDEYRIGLQKYSSDGTQLYVKTNYTDSHNGYYLVSQYIDPGSGKEDRQLRAKNDRFAKAFEERYNPPTSTSFESFHNSICNSAIDDTDYRMHGWNIWPYEGTETVSGKEVQVYVWEDQEILIDYATIMPIYVTHYKDELAGFTGTESLEEIIAKMNQGTADNPYSLERYQKGEQLAKKYGLDFHGTIASYR